MPNHWKALTQSQYPWEEDALKFIRDGLSPSSPICAWSNFEFMALSGAIYEVDLVIAGPWGIFLTEIKSRPGEISGSSGSWVWNDNGRGWTADNPLPLANRKCKELKSLLQRQQAFSNESVPFIELLIFCSHESNTLRLPDEQGHRVCVRDRKTGNVPGILAAISQRVCPGLKPFTHPRFGKTPRGMAWSTRKGSSILDAFFVIRLRTIGSHFSSPRSFASVQ